MKRLLIGLFACLCCMSCNMFPIDERYDTLIVKGCTNTNVKDRVTTYKICSYYESNGYCNVIKYRAKLGTFEIGDTVVIVKK